MAKRVLPKVAAVVQAAKLAELANRGGSVSP
jgi:hypothetical protein